MMSAAYFARIYWRVKGEAESSAPFKIDGKLFYERPVQKFPYYFQNRNLYQIDMHRSMIRKKRWQRQ